MRSESWMIQQDRKDVGSQTYGERTYSRVKAASDSCSGTWDVHRDALAA